MSRSQLSRANVLADTVQTFLGSVVHQATSPEDMADALEGFRPGYKAPDGPAVLVDEGWAIDRIDEEERAVHIAQARADRAEAEVARLREELAQSQAARKPFCWRCPLCSGDGPNRNGGSTGLWCNVKSTCDRCGGVEMVPVFDGESVLLESPYSALRGEEVAPC